MDLEQIEEDTGADHRQHILHGFSVIVTALRYHPHRAWHAFFSFQSFQAFLLVK